MEQKKNRAAVSLGRKGGLVKSEAKAIAARASLEKARALRWAKRALDLAITDESQRAPIDDEPA